MGVRHKCPVAPEVAVTDGHGGCHPCPRLEPHDAAGGWPTGGGLLVGACFLPTSSSTEFSWHCSIGSSGVTCPVGVGAGSL